MVEAQKPAREEELLLLAESLLPLLDGVRLPSPACVLRVHVVSLFEDGPVLGAAVRSGALELLGAELDWPWALVALVVCAGVSYKRGIPGANMRSFSRFKFSISIIWSR